MCGHFQKMTDKDKRKTSVHPFSKIKVSPPEPSPYLVKRQSIVSRVAEDTYSRLVLLCAPAGFGKTVAMLQLCQMYDSRETATAWLCLDEGDNDVDRFLDGFAASLSKVTKNVKKSSQSIHHSSDIAQWISGVVAESTRPLVLFFDGFETLKNPVVISLIMRGVGILPEGSKMIIGSRTSPDLGLSGLRAKGRLLELSADELRFSEHETVRFLNDHRLLDLSAGDLRHLHEITEGWPAALWLLSLGLSSRRDVAGFINSFSGADAALAAYIADDVLAVLPERLRNFLLRISILEELTPEVCEAVTGCSDSAALLRVLEIKNIFIRPVVGRENTYAFYSLFRDFLIDQLQRGFGDELPRLHRAACELYLSQQRWARAISHALKCNDPGYATTLLSRHADRFLQGGRIRLLASFIGSLPASVLSDDTRLALVYAWCLTFTRGAEHALAFMEQLDCGRLSGESSLQFQALQAMLLALQDRIAEAHDLAKDALIGDVERYPFPAAMLHQTLAQTSIILGLHEQAHVHIDASRSGQRQAIGEAGFILAESADSVLDLMHGRLRQATVRLRLATQEFLKDDRHHRRGVALSAIELAEALYENDSHDEAKYLLEVYSPMVKDVGPPDALISAHVILARLELINGNDTRALELLTELEVIGHRLNLGRVVASARLERCNVFIVMQDVNGAHEQLRQAEAIYDCRTLRGRWYISNDTLYPEMVSLRLMLRRGEASHAISSIRDEIELAERSVRVRRALELKLLLAEAHWRLGGKAESERLIADILHISKREGFQRIAREAAEAVGVFENNIGESGAVRAGPEEAIKPGSPVPLVPPTGSLAQPLTKKEFRVLELAAEGLGNQEIAEKLYISESTVRTHLRNINAKLETHSRTQAVAVMRRHGLIG